MPEREQVDPKATERLPDPGLTGEAVERLEERLAAIYEVGSIPDTDEVGASQDIDGPALWRAVDGMQREVAALRAALSAPESTTCLSEGRRIERTPGLVTKCAHAIATAQEEGRSPWSTACSVIAAIDRALSAPESEREGGSMTEAIAVSPEAAFVQAEYDEDLREQVEAEVRERFEEQIRSRRAAAAASEELNPWEARRLERSADAIAHAVEMVFDLDRALSAPESEQRELTPEECRELFSLWLCHGIPPDEIDHSHPAHTGAMKLGAAQPHPEDGDPGRSLRLPRSESEQGEGP